MTVTVSEHDEWWARYYAHLASEKWKALRAKVIEREGGLCQGCRAARAVHVHHLTYRHLGDEPLYDLAAVCKACHAREHPDRFANGDD
jgi:5-methylcytosine-specific restriction endonuclease McrA